MGRGEKRSGWRVRVEPFALTAGVPLAAALALAGQSLLSNRSLPPLAGLVPGILLYALAAASTLLSCAARRHGARSDRTGGGGEGGRRPQADGHALAPGLEWTLVIIVLLGGLYLRVHRIDRIPWGLNNDEAINAIEVSEIVHGKPFATFTERGLNRETMFHYLAAVAYRNPGLVLNLLRAMPAVFDLEPYRISPESGLMDLIFPLRSVAIAAGTLTILAVYLFARSRFGWRVAILAAIFLAVSPWHILYSRVGFRVILAPIFAIAAVGFFLRALETKQIGDHLAWGAAVGLGFWTYTSFRSIPLALVLFLVLRRRVDPEGAAASRRERRPLLYGAGLAALGLVLTYTFSHLSLWGFLARGAYATVPAQAAAGPGPLQLLLTYGRHLFHTLTMLQYFPTSYGVVQSATFIGDGVSAVYGRIGLEPETTVVAAFAALGLLYAWHRGRSGRDTASALILLSVAALVLMVGVTGPSLTRMLPNLPWLCILASLFAWRLFDDLVALLQPPAEGAAARAGRMLGRWKPPLREEALLRAGRACAVASAGIVLLALAAWSGAQGYGRYFLQAGRSDQAMQAFWSRQTIMGMFVRFLPPGPIVYVLHSYGRETLTYLIGSRPDVHLVTDPSTLDLNAIVQMPRSATFIFEKSEYSRAFAEPLRYLMTHYAQGEMTQVADPRFDPDKPIFYTFTLYKDESGHLVSPPPEQPPPGPPPR